MAINAANIVVTGRDNGSVTTNEQPKQEHVVVTQPKQEETVEATIVVKKSQFTEDMAITEIIFE